MNDHDTPLPKPRGRPRVEEPGSSISVWLPQGAHDSLIELARQQDKSVSATVRELLKPAIYPTE